MGTLYIVATPIGNLSDMTFRGIEVLKNVSFVLCEDTRHSLKLLNYYNIKKPLYAYHKFNENEKSTSYLNRIVNGEDAAVITDAGTPCISDPGYIIVKKARELGINVVGVGGISAVITALSICGLDTKSFSFYGFFPRENKDRDNLVINIKNSFVKLSVIYESPKRILKTLKYLRDVFGNINICLFSDLTKLHEKVYYGNIDKVILELTNNPNFELGEYTLIIETEKEEKEEDNNISLEAMLIDKVIKEDISIKDAISYVSKENKNISKNDLYKASLNLKEKLK